MLLAILAVVVGIIILLIIVIASQPAGFCITRTSSVGAMPAAVFGQINDFHKWQAWSPWAKMDPASKITFEGAESGVNAVYTWAGNKKVGAGRMTITESERPSRIAITVAFSKPFVANNVAEFIITPAGEQTIVTWSMTGTNGFMGKAFGLVVNCDKMVGSEFEKGLASMKRLCEGVAEPIDSKSGAI